MALTKADKEWVQGELAELEKRHTEKYKQVAEGIALALDQCEGLLTALQQPPTPSKPISKFIASWRERRLAKLTARVERMKQQTYNT